MTLAEFIASHLASGKRPNADILDRWNTRVLARGLNRLGAGGAREYLSVWGKSIGAPKCVGFALKATEEGLTAFAEVFWQKAYDLSNASGQAAPAVKTPKAPKAAAAPKATPMIATPELPSHLKPGQVQTMQPSDARQPQSHYVLSPDYFGQPKRDGHRVIATATPDKTYYQARSTKLQDAPCKGIDDALLALAKQIGTFVLDCEKTYLDVNYGEHRSGAQAAQVNLELGQPKAMPMVVLSVFKALFVNGSDLTTETESMRIDEAAPIVERLQDLLDASGAKNCCFELTPTARTTAEKHDLCERQQREGREGEIWVRHDSRYSGGKNSLDSFARTKYLLELDLVVTNLTPTTVAGRPFGAMEVARREGDTLVAMGSVGSGFDARIAAEIQKLHDEAPGELIVVVRSQGLTENKQLWHGRFVGFKNGQEAKFKKAA